MVSKDGSVIDHCEDWRTVTDPDRAAIASVLHSIFTKPEQAVAIGIDVELLTELSK